MSGTSIEQKIKAKSSAHALMNQVKKGSPILKGLIREQCKLRIKEARRQSFECSRKLQNEDKNMISALLREEIAEFEQNIELQDLIVKEMLEETENWFIEELENELKQEKYLVQINEESIVFCPICEKSNLTLHENLLKCSCGVSIVYKKTLDKFINDMEKIVKSHDAKCEQKLNFYIEPDSCDENNGILNSMCVECDHFHSF